MLKKNNNYWMYSKHAIESALLNPSRNIKEMVVEQKLGEFYKNFLKIHNIKKKIKINTASKSLIIKKIGKLAKYQGAALLVEKLFYEDKKLLEKSIFKDDFIIIIDRLNDPKNFGALLRVSYAFGITNIIILDRYMPEENGYISSIASGALDKIKVFKVSNLINTIKYLKRNNWWVIGLEAKKLKNCIDIKNQNNNFNKKVLIIGSENKGLRSLVRDNCDVLCRITTKNEDLDSINVVQATSIALYALV